jgi:hypothetical protein
MPTLRPSAQEASRSAQYRFLSMASRQAGNARGTDRGAHWPIGATSLAVGAAFFALWFWLFPAHLKCGALAAGLRTSAQAGLPRRADSSDELSRERPQPLRHSRTCENARMAATPSPSVRTGVFTSASLLPVAISKAETESSVYR